MDNLLSLILCYNYMYYFVSKLLNLLNWKCLIRYFDDTFVFVYNPFDISAILKTVNYIEQHIQYTFEFENSNNLPFLDVLVIRCDSFNKTSDYRKSFTVYLYCPHALSNPPSNQKIGVFCIYGIFALKICSDSDSLEDEQNYLKSVSVKRGFNPFVISNAVKKFKDALENLLF